MDANTLQRAGILVRALEQPPAIAGSLADPAGEEPRVSRGERGLDLGDAPAVLGERRRDLLPVVEQNVDPDPRVGAGDARHVAQRSARCRERLVPLDAGVAGLVDEQVGERVRQVARDRDEPIVRSRVDRDRPGAGELIGAPRDSCRATSSPAV